jgi:hypothetical protein
VSATKQSEKNSLAGHNGVPLNNEECHMRVTLLLTPFILLGLSGCIDVHEHPAPRDTTVVTPAPQQPSTVYAAPGTTETVVTRP